MTDVVSKEKRSEIMRRVKSKNTKPEILIRKLLHSNGYRFRLYSKDLPCHPDIVMRKYKTVIFVNGCFWHGHEGCKNNRIPKSNIGFWKSKIKKNKFRDEQCNNKLRAMGWRVYTVWECELTQKNIKKTFDALVHFLKK